VSGEQTTIAADLRALALAAVKVRKRIAYETADRERAARECSHLDEYTALLEDMACLRS